MKIANTRNALVVATLLNGVAPAQTSEQLYQDLVTRDSAKEISAPEATPLDKASTFVFGQMQTPEDSLQVRSHINKTSSAPTWRVVKPTDYLLAYDYLSSAYFDPIDSTFVLGGTGGMTVKDTTVYTYGGNTSTCFPFLANGFSSYKDGDTLYRGTQSNGGNGGLVKQSPAGCSVNTNFTTTINSITKFQGKKYVGTGQGIFVYDANDMLIQQYTSANSLLPSNSINKLLPDGGNLWIATQGGGLARFDGTNRVIYNATTTGISTFNFPKDVAVDNVGVVWAGNTKLFKFSGGSWSEVTIPIDVSQNPLNILGLTTDQFGNVWLATKYHGVLKRESDGTWKTYDTSNSPLTSNRVNAIAADTTNPSAMNIGIGSDESGFIILHESTTNYLPSVPPGAHIIGDDSVQMGQTYTYSVSEPITNAQDYVWFYTGTGATSITPKNGGMEVDITFGPGSTTGNVVCNFQNNYTKAGVNDTIQLTFAVNNITTGIDESNGVNIHPLVAPNPASDIISVLNMDNKHIKQVEVYTTDWKQVKIQALAPGEEVKVNVEDLSAGSYIMLLKDAKGNAYPAKFIKR